MPDPKTADTAFPTGSDIDVVDLLLSQHARIEEQFLLVAGAPTGAAKREAFDDLVRLLSIHETAEEELIHPLSRGLVPGGGAEVDDRLAEERQANETLAQMVKDGVDAEGFHAALLLLRNAVLTHARHEERYEFPHLRAKVPAAQLRALTTALRAAEALAPTRPHPGTESATANLVAGPILAVADRARDLIREATKNREKSQRPGGRDGDANADADPDPGLDPELDSTLDRRTDLDELRDGGPTDTPGVMTTTGGSAGPASIRRRARPGAAPTTTGDAGSGGMHGPTGGATSDNTTGGSQR